MMENIYRNDSDPVENNVRRTIREWEETPPAAWDTPPPAVWDKIAAAVPPPPAAAGIAWWQWLSGVALVLALTAGTVRWFHRPAASPDHTTPASEIQIPAIAEQTKQIKTGQDASLNNQIFNETPSTIPTPAGILDLQWFANLHFCKSLEISYPGEKCFIFFRKPFFTGYNTTARALQPGQVRTAPAVTDQAPPVQITPVQTRTSNPESSVLDELPALAEQREDHMVETPAIPSAPDASALPYPAEAIPGLTHWSVTEALPLPADRHVEPFATASQPLAMTALPIRRIPIAGHFFAGVQIAPNHTFRKIQSDRPGSQLPAFLKENESASWTTEYGIRFGWQAHRRVAFSLGVGQYSMSQQSRHRFRIPFDPGRERPAGNNNFESNYNLAVPSSYGDANVEVAVQRPANQALTPGQFLVVETRTQTDLRYISLPLTASCFLYSSPRLSAGIKGGIALSLLDKQDFSATSTITGIRGLRSRPITVQRQPPDIKKAMAEYQLGIAVWYRPVRGWTVALEPTYRRSIGPVLEREVYSVSQYAWGVQLGLQKSF